MTHPRDYRPSRPRYVRPQAYVPGLKVINLLFWVHSMARLPPEHRQTLYSLASVGLSMLTARHCVLMFGKKARMSICSAMEGRGTYDRPPFNGSVNYGTFEIMLIRPDRLGDDEEVILNHQTFEDLQELIDAFGADYGPPKPSALLNAIPRYSVYEIPADEYDERIHGAFQYDDRHNLLKAFRTNRVLFPPQKWRNMISACSDSQLSHPADGPIVKLNSWCKENCERPYAWTGFGPIWAFESPRDAFHFHMTWR